MSISKDVIARYSVSSVLKGDKKAFGKKFLFDDNEETCWNSEEGSPQWIEVQFSEECKVSGIELQFQGGFVGINCEMTILSDETVLQSEKFYPEDNNSTQTFRLCQPCSGNGIKIKFEDSSDFYGRITVYSLKILSKS